MNQLDWPYGGYEGIGYVWINAILSAPDQLRQRLAWSLYQIFPVSVSGNEYAHEYEPWASFYDIFVKNAFGNYRDVLREVTYHPLMGLFLTYHNNKGFVNSGTNPDENYGTCVLFCFLFTHVSLRV